MKTGQTYTVGGDPEVLLKPWKKEKEADPFDELVLLLDPVERYIAISEDVAKLKSRYGRKLLDLMREVYFDLVGSFATEYKQEVDSVANIAAYVETLLALCNDVDERLRSDERLRALVGNRPRTQLKVFRILKMKLLAHIEATL
jgi:hypothetical protein